MPATPAYRSDIPRLVASFLPLVILAIYAASFLPFISDDALISLRYADRLLHGQGLTWTDGQAVEGYTNLLWVLACAALGLFGVDLITASRIWGFIGMAAALLAIARAGRLTTRQGTLPAVITPCLVALSAPFAFWTIGGLEQPFVAAFLAWSLVLSLPLIDDAGARLSQAAWPSLTLGLLCLTRADGAIFCIAVGLGLLAARRFDRHAWALLGALAVFPILLGGGQVIFRLAYYGEWLPNPAFVKVAFTGQRLRQGVVYLATAAPYIAGLLLPAALAQFVGFREVRTRPRMFLFLVTAGVWGIYLVVVGGDVFPAHRQIIPLLIIAGLIVSTLERHWSGPSGFPTRAAWTVGAVAGLALLAVAYWDPKVREGREETWEWDGKIVGEFLRDAFGHADPLLACDPAGCLPYFSRFNSLDMMGLNDYHIARRRMPSFGRGIIGHELGDGRYVLDREPDLVVWSRPVGASNPMFPSAVEMSQDPRFAQHYRYVFLKTRAPESLLVGLWIRVLSPKVGVRQTADSLHIPGVLAATVQETPAMLDEHGHLGVVARADVTAILSGVSVPPGRWRLTTEPRENVRMRARAAVWPNAMEGIGEVIFDLKLQADTVMEVELAPVTGPTVHIRELTLSPAT